MGLKFDFDLFVFGVEWKDGNSPVGASCSSESVVWSVVLYGFVCAVFFAFSEVKDRPLFLSHVSFYQVVSPLSTATTV